MNKILEDLKYTESHEWIKLEKDNIVKVGITDHAQDLLGDIVYVELPDIGDKKVKEEIAGVVESVKAASDIYMPISGEIVAINENLSSNPELINQDPYGEGWFFCIKLDDSKDLDSLLSAKDYENLINE